jgi:nitrogen fixation protein NifZ
MSDGTNFELWDQPVYERGDKVMALKDVRNDGTYPGSRIGEFLIHKGEWGYVSQVGTYLNRFYVYSVDFVEAQMLVGMRAHELKLLEENERKAS